MMLLKLTIAVSDTGKGAWRQKIGNVFFRISRLPGAQGEESDSGWDCLSYISWFFCLKVPSMQSTLGKGSCFTVVLPLFPVGVDCGE